MQERTHDTRPGTQFGTRPGNRLDTRLGTRHSPPRADRIVTFAVWLALAAGCGGGNDDTGVARGSEPALADAAKASGLAEPASSLGAGPYCSLTSAEAEQLAQTEPYGAVQVEVECCGPAAVELAIAIAFGVQAAHDLPRTSPFVVRAEDARFGIVAAERLASLGVPNVVLVSP